MCELINYLHYILSLARRAEYPLDSMIVAGIDVITDAYALMQNENDCFALTADIVHSFLPHRDSFGRRVLEVLKNFDQDNDLAYALIQMLRACHYIKDRVRRNIQTRYPWGSRPNLNIRKLITEPEKKYANEFDTYLIQENYSSDSESDVESFNNINQGLAPTREEQLDRLTNELKIKLCEDCLYPNNGGGCDCWLQELGESYFD